MKTSKFRIIGLVALLAICVGNSPIPGEFPAQMASNAENISISWRHHDWWIYWNAVRLQFRQHNVWWPLKETVRSDLVLLPCAARVECIKGAVDFFKVSGHYTRCI